MENSHGKKRIPKSAEEFPGNKTNKRVRMKHETNILPRLGIKKP